MRFLLALLLLTGCGYRFDEGTLFTAYRTFSVPYALGDDRGAFTSALILEAASRLPLQYAHARGDLILQVKLTVKERENIGYRLAPKKEVEGKEVVVAQEARIVLVGCVSVVERREGKVIFGPLEVQQALTYDFEPDFSDVNGHKFSLGQLEMDPLAHEAALNALYSRLAQKMVDTLLYNW